MATDLLLKPEYSVLVHFRGRPDLVAFERLIGQSFGANGRELWYPKLEVGARVDTSDVVIVDDEPVEADEPVEQAGMFDVQAFDHWRSEWQDMPEYHNVKIVPWRTKLIHMRDRADAEAFRRLVGQRFGLDGKTTPSCWYPELEIVTFADKRYSTEPDGAPVRIFERATSSRERDVPPDPVVDVAGEPCPHGVFIPEGASAIFRCSSCRVESEPEPEYEMANVSGGAINAVAVVVEPELTAMCECDHPYSHHRRPRDRRGPGCWKCSCVSFREVE